MGNAHRFGGNIKLGIAAQRQYYLGFIREKGEKRMEVLVLGQSYHTPIVARRFGAKPCRAQEQSSNFGIKSSLARF